MLNTETISPLKGLSKGYADALPADPSMAGNRPKQTARGILNLTHPAKLWLYMFIVFGHFSEHAMQIYQIYIMGWLPKDSGGLLGLWLPALAEAEVLHFFYNGFQIAGIALLLYGFSGHARTWWKVALVFQTWHMFEHVLLQLQWLTGIYLFGASQQMGIGQLLLPRAELHFLYNLSVFIPTMVATVLYFDQRNQQRNFPQ